MAPRRKIKRYALDIVSELRSDVEESRALNLPAIDLATVLRVRPEIVIEPHHGTVTYVEDELVWKIDPDTLQVDDLVVIGRDPSHQPIVLGIADGNNEDPFNDPELADFRQNTEWLRENTQHWKSSVIDDTDLPEVDNDDGDLRFVKSTNVIYRWDGDGNTWVAASGASGNFVPTAGGNMTGDLIMDPGTMITLNDAPVNPTDVVNKAYVDALFALCCGGGGGPLIPTVTIDVTDSPYNVSPTDQVILVDSTGGPISIVMPAAHSNGDLYEIKCWSGTCATNNITITSADGDLIDLNVSFTLNIDWQAITIISDGTDWFVF